MQEQDAAAPAPKRTRHNRKEPPRAGDPLPVLRPSNPAVAPDPNLQRHRCINQGEFDKISTWVTAARNSGCLKPKASWKTDEINKQRKILNLARTRAWRKAVWQRIASVGDLVWGVDGPEEDYAEWRVFSTRFFFHAALTSTSTSKKVTQTAAAQLLEMIVFPEEHLSDRSNLMEFQRNCPYLLNFNGNWGLVAVESVINAEQIKTPDQLAAALLAQKHPQVEVIRAAVQDVVSFLLSKDSQLEYAYCLEVSPKSVWTEVEKQVTHYRLHVHLFIIPHVGGLFLGLVDLLGSRGVLREVQSTLGVKASRCHMKVYAAAFYCLCEKIGFVCSGANISPYDTFFVMEGWVWNLYQKQKITGQTAKSHFMKIARNSKSNVGVIDWAEEERLQQAVLEQQRLIMQELSARNNDFKSIDVLNDWLRRFDHLEARYPFLVLHGDSMMGKTPWAFSLAPNEEVYYVDCSANKDPCLKTYDYFQHSLIILDELGPQKAVEELKKMLQAGPDLIKMAVSPTMQFAYSRLLFRKRIIVTSNHWKEQMAKCCTESDKRWIEKNSVVYEVLGLLWHEATRTTGGSETPVAVSTPVRPTATQSTDLVLEIRTPIFAQERGVHPNLELPFSMNSP